MAQFRYRLQTLLDQKIHAKEDAQQALGVAQRELRASRDELDGCRRAQEACSERLRNARAERVSLKIGGSSGEMMRWRRDHIVRLQDECDEASDASRAQELSVSEAEERVSAARAALATRSRGVEVLEKHRARLESRHNQAAERKEAIDQEEMANVIFLREERDMRITGNPQSANPNGGAAEGAPAKPGSRFSKVLKEEAQQGSKRELPVTADVVPAAPPLMPGFLSHDLAPVDLGHAVTATPDVLLASLVQEIAAEAPPGGVSSVDIQFDSRTLDGLHVRLEKTGDKIEVRFSTASESVTRLLTANADRLTEALVQRGYVTPAVSVERVEAPAAVSPGDFRRSRREGGNRGGQDQHGGQKRG